MRQVLLVVLLTVFLSFTACSTTISGQVFNAEDFSLIQQAIVIVDSTPIQKKVTDQNGFLFNVANEGTFKVKAFVVKNQEVIAIGSDTITIVEEGNYQLDLVVFPALDLNGDLAILLNEFGTNKNASNPKQSNDLITQTILPIFGLLIIIGAVIFWIRSQSRTTTPSQLAPILPPKKEVFFSTEQKNEVTKLLAARGGRMLQKEVRLTLNWGEAYLSLIVAELEHEGKIKKIKHGRGNILILQQ